MKILKKFLVIMLILVIVCLLIALSPLSVFLGMKRVYEWISKLVSSFDPVFKWLQ